MVRERGRDWARARETPQPPKPLHSVGVEWGVGPSPLHYIYYIIILVYIFIPRAPKFNPPPPPHKMARSLREDWGDNMPLLSSQARRGGTPVRYFSLGPSPADGGSPAAGAVSAVFSIIAEAGAGELRATGRGADELEQPVQ
jgi:hypothetical protein